MTSVVARQGSLEFSSTNTTPSFTLTATGSNRLIVAILVHRATAEVVIDTCSIGGNSGTVVTNLYANLDRGCNVAVCVFPDSANPGAGSTTITYTISGGGTIDKGTLLIYELQDAPQSAPFYTIYSTDIESEITNGVGTNEDLTQNVPGEAGNLAIAFLGMTDGSFWTATVTSSANLGNDISSLVSGNTSNAYGAEDASIADADEDYTFNVALTAGSTPDNGVIGVLVFDSADTTAPSFTDGPNAITATTTGHTITGIIDETGTIYAVQTAAASSSPTAAQIKLGQDNTGSAALDSGSAAVNAEQLGSVVLAGGAANTAYRYWIYAEDDEGTPNQSTPVSVDATTSAVGVAVVDVSPAIPAPGQTVVITVSGTVNATGKTLTYNGNVITVNSQDLNTLTVNSWPYPWELSAPNVDFNTNYVLRVTDAGSSGQSNVQTQPADGEDYFAVTGMATVPDESIYSNDVGLADGDKHWGYFSNGGASGSITTNGLLRNVENGAIYTYRLRDETDGLWGGSANATVFIDAADVSATLTLVDGNQNVLANLVNIQYAFFDTTDLTNMTAPSVRGTAESTNASGLLEIVLSTSTLTSGQTGTLIIKDSSGRKAHYEVTVA